MTVSGQPVTLKIFCEYCGGALSVECEWEHGRTEPLNSKGFNYPSCQKVMLIGVPGKLIGVTPGHAEPGIH